MIKVVDRVILLLIQVLEIKIAVEKITGRREGSENDRLNERGIGYTMAYFGSGDAIGYILRG